MAEGLFGACASRFLARSIGSEDAHDTCLLYAASRPRNPRPRAPPTAMPTYVRHFFCALGVAGNWSFPRVSRRLEKDLGEDAPAFRVQLAEELRIEFQQNSAFDTDMACKRGMELLKSMDKS